MTNLFDELSFKISKDGSWLFFSFSTVNLMLGCCRFRKVKKRLASVSLLRGAINKQRYEKQKLEKELERLKTNVRSLVTGIDWCIIWRSIHNHVCKKRKKILPTQEKKLKNLTFNKVIPFNCDDIVKNLSTLNFQLRNWNY